MKKFYTNDFLKEEFKGNTVYDDVILYDFPLHTLPGDFQFLFKMLNDKMNYNVDVLCTSFISLIGTIIGNKMKLRVKDDYIAPPIFWNLIVGETGTMKTHPVKYILKPLKEHDIQNFKRYEKEKTEYDVEFEATGGKPTIKKPKFHQSIIDEFTLEALYEVHTINKNGILMFKDELIGWIKSFNQYRAGSDEEFWIESYNNGTKPINRASKEPKMLEDININILGSIQPSVLRSIKSGSNGMLERMLFTRIDDKFPRLNNKKIDPRATESYNYLIKSYINQLATYDDNIIEIEDNVFDYLCEVNGKLVDIQESKETTTLMRGYISKIITYFPRFILVLFFLDDENESVVKKHIDDSNDICQYFINNAKKIFEENLKTSDMEAVSKKGTKTIDKVLELLRDGYKGKEVAEMMGISVARVSQIKNSNK